MAKLPQVSMSAGEISPSLHGRTDLARYLIALKTCRNFRVRHTGGVSNREGSEFVTETNLSGLPRLIPFTFSVEQAYMLETGDGYITPFADGAPIQGGVAGTFNQAIAFVTATDRSLITFAAHGLSVGDRVLIIGDTGTGAYDFNGLWMVRAVPASNQFNIDGTGSVSGLAGSLGQTFRVSNVVTPYDEDDLNNLKWTQSADILTIVNPDFLPYEFRRTSATTFTFTPGVFEKGPFSSVNEIETLFVHASGVLGSVTLTATQDVFQAGHVGALFYLEQRDDSVVPPWEPSRRLTTTGVNCFGQLRRSDEKNYQCVTDFVPTTNEVITGTVRPTHDHGVAPDGNGQAIAGGAERGGVDWLYLDSGFGIFRITGFTNAKTVTATVLTRPPALVVGGATLGVGPFTMVGDGVDVTLAVAGATSGDPTKWEVTFDGVIQSFDSYSVNATTDVLTFAVAPAVGVNVSARQLSQNNRSDIWAFGAWSEVNGYPSEVEYYGDRIIFGSTRAEPQTVWMSKVGDYSNFVTSRPVVDDDPVSATLNARQVNKITNLVPLENLVVLTKGSEWRATGGADDVITPTSIGFKPQSYNGAKPLPAQIIDSSAVYVQDRGDKVRDMLQTVDQEGNPIYTGNDLSVTAEHLIEKHTIDDWTLQNIPSKTLWMCRDDGVLLSLTYLREHQVIGWAPHDLGGGGLARRVACIPEGADDRVYMVVERVIGGVTKRYIERMSTRSYSHIRDSIFLDSTLSYDGRNTTFNTVILNGSGWTVSDTLTLTAGLFIFSASSVGDQVILDYGLETELRLTVTAYIDPTNASVVPEKDVIAQFQGIATTNWATARDTFAGLKHLEGEEVMALVDANVQGPFTVTSGQVTLDSPGAVVHIGLQYNCDIETLDLTVPGGYIRGSSKNIPKVDVLVQESRGIQAGPNADTLYEFKQADDSDNYNPLLPFTGLAPIGIDCSWSKDARVFIRQSYPLPITILGIAPEVKYGGSG